MAPIERQITRTGSLYKSEGYDAVCFIDCPYLADNNKLKQMTPTLSQAKQRMNGKIDSATDISITVCNCSANNPLFGAKKTPTVELNAGWQGSCTV
jgi:hypothetical protein